MGVCSAINCYNRTENARLFRLPEGKRNLERRKIWIENIGRKRWNARHGYICEAHFTPNQFEQNRQDGRKLLKWNAIPTIFPSKETKIRSRFVKRAKLPAKTNEELYEENIISCILPTECTDLANNSTSESASKSHEPMVILKVEPNNEDNSTSSESIHVLRKDIVFLNRKLLDTKRKMRKLESMMSNFHEHLGLIYNEDQIKCLKLPDNNEEILWNEETMEKAKILFMACGVKGYNEILNQRLPFPALEMLYKCYPELSPIDV